jgi:hypothetical protein
MGRFLQDAFHSAEDETICEKDLNGYSTIDKMIWECVPSQVTYQSEIGPLDQKFGVHYLRCMSIIS